MFGLDIKHIGWESLVSCSSHAHLSRNTSATCWGPKVLGSEILFTVSDWRRIVQRGQKLSFSALQTEARTWKPGSLVRKVWSCWASGSPGQLELCSPAICPGVMDPGFSFHGEFHVFDCFLAQFWNICCTDSHGRQNGGNKVFLNSLCLTTVLWKLTHS